MNRHSSTNMAMLFVGVAIFSGNVAVGSIGDGSMEWSSEVADEG